MSLIPVIALTVTGCDVRLETPPLTEPIPDAVEQVRRTAADDAISIADAAAANLWVLGAADPALPNWAEMERVQADAQAHLNSLGGVYVSGLEPNVEDASLEAPEVETISGYLPLIQLLNQAAARNLNAAAVDASGDKARLLAAIGTSQALAAQRVAAIQGIAEYDPISELIMAGWTGGTHEGLIGDAATLGEPEGNEATGITVADFQAIVKSEDAARYAFEVAAARNTAELRVALRQRARTHGARAQAWAALGQIAETDQDPRLVAYQVPEGLTPAELVLYIEKELSVRWASLIATAAPGARGSLIEALLASQLTVAQWGGGTSTFPGVPELDGGFGGTPAPADQPRIPYEWAAELPEEAPSGPVE